MKKYIIMLAVMLIGSSYILALSPVITPYTGQISQHPDWTHNNCNQQFAGGNHYISLLNSDSHLITPEIDFTELINPKLVFKARTWGVQSGETTTLEVKISTDGGETWQDLAVSIQNINELRMMEYVDLSDYSSSQLKIKFATPEAGNNQGVGLDDIMLVSESDYYVSLEGLSGEELKNALHILISMYHNSQDYSNSRLRMFGHIDNFDDYVTCVYTNMTFEVEYNTMPHHQLLNAEHVYPQSWYAGIAEEYIAKADLHHIYPTFPPANSSRANYPFDYATTILTTWGEDGYLSYCGHNFFDQPVFEPRDPFKGDAARAIMYFVVRYDYDQVGFEHFGVDMLPVLMQWHLSDPPSEEDIYRNDEIHLFQLNRNPFIDNPDYATSIWGEIELDAPLVYEATNVSSNSFEAQWSNIPEADRYFIDVAHDEEFKLFYNNLKNKQVTQNYLLVEGNFDYPVYYRVRAANDEYLSLNSEGMEVAAVSTEQDIVFSPERIISNYPNPFNSKTTLYINLNESDGKLEIFNIKGEKLFGKTFEQGEHNFVWDADGKASGVYLVRLSTGVRTFQNKMLLLK